MAVNERLFWTSRPCFVAPGRVMSASRLSRWNGSRRWDVTEVGGEKRRIQRRGITWCMASSLTGGTIKRNRHANEVISRWHLRFCWTPRDSKSFEFHWNQRRLARLPLWFIVIRCCVHATEALKMNRLMVCSGAKWKWTRQVPPVGLEPFKCPRFDLI